MRASDIFTIVLSLASFLAAAGARGGSTISTLDSERFAYGTNISWINFRPDTGSPGEGAVVTGFFLSGFVYGANIGWIHLGDGSPADGIRYQNTDAVDFGVNHDGFGGLSGRAYGANVGWINFGDPAQTWASPPRVDLASGEFSGYAYGANVGWIDLGENGLAGVVTTSFAIGPDTDGDGIADAWEYEKVIAAGQSTGDPVADLMLLSAAGDADSDGVGDIDEFFFGSNPFSASSTISTAESERCAYGANVSWINFNPDTGYPGEGATVTSFFLSGFVYGTNVGWINLGDGSPADGIRYQNTDAADFGVNHDGAGGLSGRAYGANVGWINFGGPAPTWASPPRVDLASGEFNGYAYGANVGWINLGGNGLAGAVTTSFAIGPDTDGDGIADAWEYERMIAAGQSTGDPIADLMLLSAAGDADSDGVDDVEEFIGDSNPFLAGDRLQWLSGSREPALEMAELEWTSSPRRLYDIYWTIDMMTFTLEQGNITPGPDQSTSFSVSDPQTGVRRFWQVRVRRPLSP